VTDFFVTEIRSRRSCYPKQLAANEIWPARLRLCGIKRGFCLHLLSPGGQPAFSPRLAAAWHSSSLSPGPPGIYTLLGSADLATWRRIWARAPTCADRSRVRRCYRRALRAEVVT
jgi:hypothetical protein